MRYKIDKEEQIIREERQKRYNDFIRYKKHLISLGLPKDKPCPVCGTIINEEINLTGKEKYRLRKERGDKDIWTCPICVQRMTDPPLNLQKKKIDTKMRGWTLMKVYVHKDGRVYHKGIEQPELKGTLPITIQKKPKKKLSKKEKEELKHKELLKLNELIKERKNPKLKKTAKKKLDVLIRKQNRILSKLRI